jgi:DNA-binding MarR family transcriptional regulator
MVKSKFDPLIHAQNRLHICAMLAATAELEFKVLRDELGISDSVMSKHLKSLEEANYICCHKRKNMGRQRTWLGLSTLGRTAYQGHLAALKEIVGQV